MPYAWAAYRKGAFTIAGKPVFAEGLNGQGFADAYGQFVLSNYDACWTLFGGAPGGDLRPIGLVHGIWPVLNPARQTFMILADFIWFPWASPRQRLAAVVHFLGRIRHSIPMMGYVEMKDVKFFDAVCRHGVLRTVGFSHIVLRDERCAVYETRRGGD